MVSDHAIAVLVLNGAIVFFVGMLVGIPYGVLRVRGASAAAQDNWRIAHVQNLQNGLLLLVVAACTPYTELPMSATAFMVYSLVVAAYCDMAAWLIRPLTGHTGFLPEPPTPNLLVFALFSVTLLGQFSGFSTFIYGAWVHWSGLGAA